ncbi:bifunctional (p)ppGpp synthetase/guanosine-3',5'-bis(diphosphate) 3'-pyrophosphohydrolase [Acidovorax sp. HDW3]|uniref:RelA/SpoT family protein n=1 Tax=Acidovorax sp. HDW3 TaxID=2714923 RepID=UPI0014081242|nr:bifunctional (p)ppGpp synthetase/guanosine-3',5'-bis(diphosphate) 3'-pyrophosphohydrolase [Acidovorax sp. HDW3]QIL44347.1 bifunctional (p)ppGpp synthetase/guanosine-3',5'-bis(diphosphate) 3'-pyrophosphohydrolase [Acidovorax sp. HDW3]
MKSIVASAPPSLVLGEATPAPISPLIAATAQQLPEQVNALGRARAFAEPLLAAEVMETGENTLEHADAVAAILRDIGGSEAMQAASYLVHACVHLNKPEDVIAKAFGQNFATLAVETTKLMRVQQQARAAEDAGQRVDDAQLQTENVRKMLLGFSRDLRVVLLRLASRLQTLRYYAASKRPVSPSLAREALQVFAPLANRLGIWQMKWELEDLSFRFLEPDTYKQIARLLDEKRVERELNMEQLRSRLEAELRARSISATVSGRPKHIYSIVKKMRGKSLPFEQVFDIRALRVIVPSVKDCYATLSWVHEHFESIPEEFDDYIAKPKPNGYQSLHTVVRDGDGRATEIQIRTQAMHDHAEHGVAAHWAYKEAGTKGYAGVSASGEYDAKIAVLRQLLAWGRDMADSSHSGLFDDRIYVLTPDAAVIELPQGATPVDFAYAVHTSLGHRCRGARIDGAMVSLNTPLQSGQTVEITTVKEGRPSRDWLNAELGYLVSPRSRAKVRAWFNAQALHETIGRGREAVEKLLQREGKTALKLDDLAVQLGFKNADALFEVVGKDEFSLRNIENLLRPSEPEPAPEEQLLLKKPRPQDASSPKGGVLVVGVDSLMTQLAKCCRPAPPDEIAGFVTRGKGVSVHRRDCSNFREMQVRSAERVIDVAWGQPKTTVASTVYPVDVAVEAADRQGLLRDISEVFAREKTNVIGVQTQSVKGTAWMTFTVEVSDSGRLNKVLAMVAGVQGVRAARRR